MKKIGIVTGNQNKIKEIKEIIKDLNLNNIKINMIDIFDLPEPKTSWDKVILYKAKILSNVINKLKNIPKYKKYTEQDSYIVEDTIVYIREDLNWKEIVDIKWLINELKNFEGRKIKWQTSIGVVENKKIKIYTNDINGIIKNTELEGFGFDPYFYLPSKNKVIAELPLEEKNKISPRNNVFKQYFLNKKPYLEIELDKINIDNNIKWQNDYSYKDFLNKIGLNNKKMKLGY